MPFIIAIVLPIVLKVIDIIPVMLTRKKEMPRVRKIKHQMRNRVLILAGKPTISEIAEAGRGR